MFRVNCNITLPCSSIDGKQPFSKSQIRRWVQTVEERDDSVGHSDRVARLAAHVTNYIDGADRQVMEMNALLHDVGKMVIPTKILRKPTSLTRREYQVVKFHAQMGGHIVQNIPDYAWAAEGAFFHHERYDGKGYPYGLKDTDIPLNARIISVVDCFDAMVSLRPYGQVYSTDEAIHEIARCRGTQFDPAVVDAMIRAVNDGLL